MLYELLWIIVCYVRFSVPGKTLLFVHPVVIDRSLHHFSCHKSAPVLLLLFGHTLFLNNFLFPLTFLSTTVLVPDNLRFWSFLCEVLSSQLFIHWERITSYSHTLNGGFVIHWRSYWWDLSQSSTVQLKLWKETPSYSGSHRTYYVALDHWNWTFGIRFLYRYLLYCDINFSVLFMWSSKLKVIELVLYRGTHSNGLWSLISVLKVLLATYS